MEGAREAEGPHAGGAHPSPDDSPLDIFRNPDQTVPAIRASAGTPCGPDRILPGCPMRLSACLLVLLVGCTSSAPRDATPVAPTRAPTVTDSWRTTDVDLAATGAVVVDRVAASPDRVFAALEHVFEDLGVDVTQSSGETLQLANPRFVVSRRIADVPLSRYLECGRGMQGPFADRYRIEMSIQSRVSPEGDGAKVETYIEAMGRNPEGGSNTTVRCASNQRLEREIAERIRVHLGTGGGVGGT